MKKRRRDRDTELLGSRYRVAVEFHLFAESAEEAEDLINDLVRDIKIMKIDLNEEDPIDEYDISDIEPI